MHEKSFTKERGNDGVRAGGVVIEVIEKRTNPPIKDFMVIGGVDEIGTLAHAGRLAVLRALSQGPKTGADVARELDQPANRVHYHLGKLLKLGLIVEVCKGRKRWKEERYFQATARHFIVDPRIGCRDEGTSALSDTLDRHGLPRLASGRAAENRS